MARMAYEAGQGTRPAPHAGVEDGRGLGGLRSGLALQEHPRVVVGQVEQASGQVHGDRVGRIEAEEPDAGVAVRQADVGPHVGFVEAREPPDGGESDRPHSGHGERDQADVGRPVKQVQLQLGGDEAAQGLGRKRPVHEEQVAPFLPHDRPLPGPLGSGIRRSITGNCSGRRGGLAVD